MVGVVGVVAAGTPPPAAAAAAVAGTEAVGSSTAATPVSRFLAALQLQLKQDWARTQGDIRVNSGVPLDWLKGCNPRLSQQQFAAKWQRAGALYVLVDGEGPRVCVPHLSVSA